MTTLKLTAWLLLLATGTPLLASPTPPVPEQPPEVRLAPPAAAAADWIVSASDSICGLRDPDQLSKPAKIDFERCLAATPEMKRMKKEGIRPQSPEGIQLRTEAVDRVTRASNTVREAGGFCSVWKAIEHSDGRAIPDLTSRVLGQY